MPCPGRGGSWLSLPQKVRGALTLLTGSSCLPGKWAASTRPRSSLEKQAQRADELRGGHTATQSQANAELTLMGSQAGSLAQHGRGPWAPPPLARGELGPGQACPSLAVRRLGSGPEPGRAWCTPSLKP